MRDILFGPSEAVYSGYTCYTGIADFVPADIDTVGYVISLSPSTQCIMISIDKDVSKFVFIKFFPRYRVFLGHKQYFVSSDVGQGKMQWYAFHNESPGGVDIPKGNISILFNNFDSRLCTC